MTAIRKFHNHYSKPTDTKWRKFGDALLGASTTITTFAIYNESNKIAITALVLGVAGKFITNLFKKDEQE